MNKYPINFTQIMNKYRLMLAVELYQAAKGTDLEQDVFMAVSWNSLIPYNEMLEGPREVIKRPMEYMLEGYTEPIKLSVSLITKRN